MNFPGFFKKFAFFEKFLIFFRIFTCTFSLNGVLQRSGYKFLLTGKVGFMLGEKAIANEKKDVVTGWMVKLAILAVVPMSTVSFLMGGLASTTSAYARKAEKHNNTLRDLSLTTNTLNRSIEEHHIMLKELSSATSISLGYTKAHHQAITSDLEKLKTETITLSQELYDFRDRIAELHKKVWENTFVLPET